MADKPSAFKTPEVEVAVLSETGKREENQDWMSWTRVPWGECYIVADGMGGYQGGATASRMTVEGLERWLKEEPPEWPVEVALAEAVRKANEEVHRAAQSGDPKISRMGSTVVVALVSGRRLIVAHIGDSRAYLFRNGKLKQLTTDHTSVQRMVEAGMLTARQARHHPDAHILSRAIGAGPQVEIEIAKPLELQEGDGILLCSDGLSGYVEDEQIEKALTSQADVQRLPRELVDLALQNGSDDNITVQFVLYGKRRHHRRSALARFVRRGGVPALAAAAAVAVLFAVNPVREAILGPRARESTTATADSKTTPGTPPAVGAPPAAGASASAGNLANPAKNNSSTTPPSGPPAQKASARKSEDGSLSKGRGQSTPVAKSATSNPTNAKGQTAGGQNAGAAAAAADRSPAAEAPTAVASDIASPPQGALKIHVIVLVSDDSEETLVNEIENVLIPRTEYKLDIVRRKDLGNPPDKPFIFYTDKQEGAAQRLQALLERIPGLGNLKRSAYDKNVTRKKQYQEKLEPEAGAQHLLVVFPGRSR